MAGSTYSGTIDNSMELLNGQVCFLLHAHINIDINISVCLYARVEHLFITHIAMRIGTYQKGYANQNPNTTGMDGREAS